MADPLFQLPCSESEQPMHRIRGPRINYDGDDEVTEFVFECHLPCLTSATVSYRHYIPVDVARMRQEDGPAPGGRS